jgi:hypothetical protein
MKTPPAAIAAAAAPSAEYEAHEPPYGSRGHIGRITAGYRSLVMAREGADW